MTALSNNMPGWFKRRQAGEQASGAPLPGEQDSSSPAPVEDSNSTTASIPTGASTTTGGGSSSEPVVVWEAANLMEAQVVKARLESEGIPAFIRNEAAGVIYGLTAGSLARADVLVPGPLADKAVELLFGEEDEADSRSDSGVSG
jgi:hypothetical protein